MAGDCNAGGGEVALDKHSTPLFNAAGVACGKAKSIGAGAHPMAGLGFGNAVWSKTEEFMLDAEREFIQWRSPK